MAHVDINDMSEPEIRSSYKKALAEIEALRLKANRGANKETEVEFGRFKGNPTVTIKGNHPPLTFGLSKARSVVKVAGEISKWVEAHKDTVVGASTEY